MRATTTIECEKERRLPPCQQLSPNRSTTTFLKFANTHRGGLHHIAQSRDRSMSQPLARFRAHLPCVHRKASREAGSTLFRFLTGHVFTVKYSQRFHGERVISSARECDFSPQTINHVVFDCPRYDAACAANPHFDEPRGQWPKRGRQTTVRAIALNHPLPVAGRRANGPASPESASSSSSTMNQHHRRISCATYHFSQLM
jgi:hypothetical protein